MAKRKATEYERELQLHDVQHWIADRVPESMICDRVVKEGWGTKAYAKSLIKEALARWVDDSKSDIETRRKMSVIRLQLLSRTLKPEWKGTPAGVRALLEIEKDINKLEGNYSPDKVEHGFDGNTLMDNPINIIIRK